MGLSRKQQKQRDEDLLKQYQERTAGNRVKKTFTKGGLTFHLSYQNHPEGVEYRTTCPFPDCGHTMTAEFGSLVNAYNLICIKAGGHYDTCHAPKEKPVSEA